MTKVLAQLNIATALAPLDSPQLADFVDNLDRINGVAEQSPGFIWRLKDDTGNATDIQAFDNPQTIVNMSVWQDADALKNFMFKTDHLSFMKRKAQWFEKSSQATYVLWWIDAEHRPTITEAIAKLEYLRAHGETQAAFSFKQLFPAI
ncbi:DUF3291 domain-containing protein [Thalassotalea euphylliae]|uniref:DUF3291 domain-containing protein n=1 Tax=Thalassotalea euphylliae TaxID=1655234 RepID=A0A3E0UHC7_9GAMM|nr:DUF3291 domain-containing protein [Thalassotalea euphylliae]REL36266.1 DUF3291 domain-containing protein [Thalassotalea euphylliae]